MKNISWKITKCKRWTLYGLTSICLLTGFACDEEYDDTWIKEAIEDLRERVTTLEEWCQTTNSNISSLQSLTTALEERDYITNVTPVTENGVKIGYTITFKNAPAIIIYHGQDGEKGESASVPKIGVIKGDDGKYYWTQTIGDAKTEFILDEAGNKIPASGIAPKLSVDSDGYWLIDADGNGFVRLKDIDGHDVKAVGEKGDTGDSGATGPQGPAGNSIFSKVDYSDPTYVFFYLNDGTKIQLPRYNLTNTQEEYDALAKAISEATGTADNPTVIELTEDILIGENSNFVIDGQRHIIIDGKGHKIDRGDDNNYASIFLVIEGSSLTLRNIILDGNDKTLIMASYEPLSYDDDITTVILDNGTILQNGGPYAIELYGAKFQMKGDAVIKDSEDAFMSSDITSAGFGAFYFNGGNFINCKVHLQTGRHRYDNSMIYIAKMPNTNENEKIRVRISSADLDKDFVLPIIVPVDGCQLNLDDFDFIVGIDEIPYEIFLDNDGIIKLRVTE